jgi:hypothetical protein
MDITSHLIVIIIILFLPRIAVTLRHLNPISPLLPRIL